MNKIGKHHIILKTHIAMANIHSSSEFDYKIVPVRDKFAICFKSRRFISENWKMLNFPENDLETAITRLKRNIEKDDEESALKNEGIDFDLNPKPEPDAAV